MKAKECTKCHQYLSYDHFGNLKKGKDGKCSYCKDCARKMLNQWWQDNKHRKKPLRRMYRKERIETDNLYRFILNTKSAIRSALRNRNKKVSLRSKEILGIDFSEFIIYFESLFKEGMNWDNMKLWHIDHIIPISLAQTEEEVILLSNYRNLQPLWKSENLKKSNSITPKGRKLLKEWDCEYLLEEGREGALHSTTRPANFSK